MWSLVKRIHPRVLQLVTIRNEEEGVSEQKRRGEERRGEK
jgi:hypothetical protein